MTPSAGGWGTRRAGARAARSGSVHRYAGAGPNSAVSWSRSPRRSSLPISLNGSSSRTWMRSGVRAVRRVRRTWARSSSSPARRPGAAPPRPRPALPTRRRGCRPRPRPRRPGARRARLDLARRKVLAAPHDHVVEPALDEQEAVGVDAARVASVEPALDGSVAAQVLPRDLVASRLRWRNTAALGSPVVPLVNSSTATASGSQPQPSLSGRSSPSTDRRNSSRSTTSMPSTPATRSATRARRPRRREPPAPRCSPAGRRPAGSSRARTACPRSPTRTRRPAPPANSRPRARRCPPTPCRGTCRPGARWASSAKVTPPSLGPIDTRSPRLSAAISRIMPTCTAASVGSRQGLGAPRGERRVAE